MKMQNKCIYLFRIKVSYGQGKKKDTSTKSAKQFIELNF